MTASVPRVPQSCFPFPAGPAGATLPPRGQKLRTRTSAPLTRTSRAGVVVAEARGLWKSAWQGLRHPTEKAAGSANGGASFRHDFRQLWSDADYRSQATGRWMTHLGQGMGSGVQMMLLSMTTSMTASQGLLVNSCINAAELGVHQVTGLWRGLFSDDARNGAHLGGGGGKPRLARHQLVSRLLIAGIYEAGLAACLLGVLACRGARLLQGRRILFALAAVRVARILCQTTQWAGFDGLKGQLADPGARDLVKRRWDSTKAVETGVGLSLNQGAAIACQLLPYAVGVPSVAGAMACLMGAGLVISLAGKLQLCRYLDGGR